MAKTVYGEYSRDGYGYWGYVETERRMMLFSTPKEYYEYISEHRSVRKEPYWKQHGSSFFTTTK